MDVELSCRDFSHSFFHLKIGNMKFVSELFVSYHDGLNFSRKRRQGHSMFWYCAHLSIQEETRNMKKKRLIFLIKSKIQKNTKDRHDNITVSNAVIPPFPHTL